MTGLQAILPVLFCSCGTGYGSGPVLSDQRVRPAGPGGHTASMDWRARITTDPAISHGTARIKGTRIMASVVSDNLAAGESVDEILSLYPTLRREDVTAVMAYAADLLRERVVLTTAA